MASTPKSTKAEYMDRVFEFSLGLQSEEAIRLDALSFEERETPRVLDPLATKTTSALAAHQVALKAAAGFIDAVGLECPGTDRELAISHVGRLFELQDEHGLMSLGGIRNEFLTSSFGHLWDAAMSAILYVSFQHRDQLGGLFETTARWWRTYLGLLERVRVEVTWPSGAPMTLAPCLRGATPETPEKAVCRSRDEILALVHGFKGEAGPEDRELTGLRMWQAMENVPIASSGRQDTWKLPCQLVTQGSYRTAGMVAYLPKAVGLQAQWMVGTMAEIPFVAVHGLRSPGFSAISVPGGWAAVAVGEAAKTGGPCPVSSPLEGP